MKLFPTVISHHYCFILWNCDTLQVLEWFYDPMSNLPSRRISEDSRTWQGDGEYCIIKSGIDKHIFLQKIKDSRKMLKGFLKQEKNSL